jgi:membrane protease YdiL (CAAX protease family)
MSDATMIREGTLSGPKWAQLLFDIVFVFAVSLLAYYLEGLASNRDWFAIGVDGRGVSAVVAGAAAAVGIVLIRGGSLADLGFKKPQRWFLVLLQAFIILLVFIAAQILLPLLVSLFATMPEADMSRYDSISGNLQSAIMLALLLPLTASIPEEIIYRGFLIGRLRGVFGPGPGVAFISVLLQAVVFAGAHFVWGMGGMIVTFLMGIIWGTAYLLCDRNLWVVIIAHSAGHVLFVVQLYLATSFFF